MATPRKHPRKKVAPRKRYAVEQHPQRDAIIKALVRGTSHRAIARKYATLSHDAISHYLRSHLLEQAARELAKRDRSAGAVLLDEIEAVKAKLQKLLDACDEYLLRSDDPTRYDLGPRAHEIDVTFYRRISAKGEPAKYATRTETRTLQALLDELRGHLDPVIVRWHISDPRKLIVETAEALTRQLELVAKVQGQIPALAGDVTRSQAWQEIKAFILIAVRGHPEVLEKIVAAIESAGAR